MDLDYELNKMQRELESEADEWDNLSETIENVTSEARRLKSRKEVLSKQLVELSKLLK